jgi:hyperosmotically inducible periplasmic protein
MNKSVVGSVVLASVLVAGASMAQSTPAVPADNSKSNQIDSTNRSTTADSQSNKTADLNITQQIRKSLMADKTLSVYAHNIKIVTVNGNVTLNGVVRSADEKASIESRAQLAAGSNSSVTSDLKVAPPK